MRVTGALLRSTPVQMKVAVARQLKEKVWLLLGVAIILRVAATDPLDRATDAYRYLEQGHQIGKMR